MSILFLEATDRTTRNHHVDFNSIEVGELFQKYEDIGFIYPAKKALLEPYFDQIRENWKRMLSSKEDLMWVFTSNADSTQKFASTSAWRQTRHGMQAQHLVSNGNPFLSLRVMLAAQHKAEYNPGEEEVRSSQNWFRPNNRYAYRVFASMYKKLGPQKASLILFQYLHLDLDYIKPYIQKDFTVEEVKGIDPEFMEFVKTQTGEVFLRGEELDQEDIELKEFASTYEQYDLQRSRKVLKIRDTRTQKIRACIIANRAPIGVNFSFLENRAYYLVDQEMEIEDKRLVLECMNAAIKPYYQDFALNAIPIVTDTSSSELLQKLDARWLREYMQSIWMKEGFSQWYAHIDSFLRKIESRLNRNASMSAKGAA